MAKRNLSIRKNSRSYKNKIPKKSKKPVIKKGVKGRGKIKGKTKVNKRVVKSKHLQRKHSKNKNEKKRKYSKKKNRMIGGYFFTHLINNKNFNALKVAMTNWEENPNKTTSHALAEIVNNIASTLKHGGNQWNETQDILHLLDEYSEMTGEYKGKDRVYTGSATIKSITSVLEALRQEGMIPLDKAGMRMAKAKILNLINSAHPTVFEESVMLNPNDPDEFNFLKTLSQSFSRVWVTNIEQVHKKLEKFRPLNVNTPDERDGKLTRGAAEITYARQWIEANQPYPYRVTDNMITENKRDNFGGSLRDLSTKYYDKSTTCTNLNTGGGAINLLAGYYNAYGAHLKSIWERYYKDWGGGAFYNNAGSLSYTYQQIFDLSYNYNKNRADRYCYISGEISPNVLSLEHKYAYFDGLILGILVSDRLEFEARHWLDGDDLIAWMEAVLILHPLSAAGPNERKSNQGLLNTFVIQDRRGNSIIQMGRLPDEYYKRKVEGRSGTACWWGLKDSNGNDNNGGWYQITNKGPRSRYTHEQIRTLQNNFLDAVIGTVNELLSRPNVSEFLLLWTGLMSKQFNGIEWSEHFHQDFSPENLEQYATEDLVDGQCDDFNKMTHKYADCQAYIKKRQAEIEKERSSTRPWHTTYQFVGAS